MIYNQIRYIEQAIEAAFSQTYPCLEILVSDDASSDGSAAAAAKLINSYKGPHKVSLNVNRRNLGIGNHINHVFSLAEGELIVFAAGDDISSPERTSKIVDFWLKKNKKLSAIYSSARTIDLNGNFIGRFTPHISKCNRETSDLIRYGPSARPLLLLGACSAYTPDVMVVFGPFPAQLQVEDIPLAIRASLLNGVGFINEELVSYRINTSVWITRKEKGEIFEKHYARLVQRTIANYYVSLQILLDVRKSLRNESKNLAFRRFIKDKFTKDCYEKKSFSIKKYFRVASTSHSWKDTLYPSILFGLPRFHKLIFLFKNLFS